MKRLILFSALGVVIALAISIVYLFPTREKVLSNAYDITNSTYDNKVNAEIIPADIDLSNKKVNINKTLLNDVDTRIYLDSIFIDNDGRIVILIKGKSKWHFLKGSCLSIISVIKNDTGYTYGGAPVYFKLADENGNAVNYLQAGKGPGEMVSIILSKEVFLKCKSLNIEIGGFNLIKYTRKSIL